MTAVSFIAIIVIVIINISISYHHLSTIMSPLLSHSPMCWASVLASDSFYPLFGVFINGSGLPLSSLCFF